VVTPPHTPNGGPFGSIEACSPIGRFGQAERVAQPAEFRKEKMKHLNFVWLLLVLLALAACGQDVAPDVLKTADIGVPTITSDKDDYAPGELVTLTGSNWQAGESVHINVDDDQTKKWSRDVDVTANANGEISDQFNLPDVFVATYKVTATGAESGTATAGFTDGTIRFLTTNASTNFATTWTKHTHQSCSTGSAGGSSPSSGSGTVRQASGSTLTAGANAGEFIKITAPATIGSYSFQKWTGPSNFSSTATTLCAAGFTGNNNNDYKAEYVLVKAEGSVSISNIPSNATVGGNFTPTYTKLGDGTASTASTTTSVCTVSAGTVNFVATGTCKLQASVTEGTNHLATTGAEQTFTIAAPPKQNQTITFAEPTSSQTYDATFNVNPLASSGLAVTLAASGACSATPATAPATGYTVKMTSGTGTCTLKASQAGNGSLNAAEDVTRMVNAAKANQTISFADNTPANKTEGDAEFTISASATSELTVAFSAKAGSTCSVSNAGLVRNLEEGVCTVVALQDGNNNYNAAANVEHIITVAAPPKKDQTIDFERPSSPQVYLSDFVVDPTASSNLDVTVTVDGVCTLDGNKVTMTSGTGNCYVTAAQAGNRYYNAAAPVLYTVAAAKAEQAISWDAPAAITYGAVLDGNQLNAMQTAGDGALIYDPPAGSVLGAGVRSLKVTAAETDNYKAASKEVSITVNKRAITVTAATQSKIYGDDDPPLSYSITNGSLANGDSLSGALSRDTGENVGSYAIGQGSLSGGDNYQLTFAGAELTITKRAITVTSDAKSKQYGDADPALTYQVDNLRQGDSLSGALTRDEGQGVGDYAIAQGSLTADTNYDLTFVGSKLTITKRAITVTAESRSKIYGEGDPTLTYSITGGSLVNGDSLSGALSRNTGENVGTYAIGQGTLGASTNYTLTFVGANLTITQRSISVMADAKSKVYGEADPVLTYRVNGLINGDSLSGTLSRIAGERVGSYAIGQGSLTAGNNYRLTFTGATLTIGSWTLKGFYAPVDMGIKNNAKGGSTVPLKFEVFAGSAELTSTSTIASSLQKVSCVATAGDDIEVYATGGTSLRYDTVAGQFIFNWQTPKQAGACYRVTLTTNDGSSIYADFQLR
jgi:hypothetical protein